MSTLLPPLLPLLDGTRTIDDIAERIGLAARPAIERALDTLAAHGLLADGPSAPAEVRETAHAFAASHALSPADAADRLARGTVGIVGSGGRGIEVARLLRLAGVREVRRVSWRRGADVPLTVVAPAADEVDALPAWNELALRRNLTWLPLRPFDGRLAAIGPIVVPGESCCYECVLLRRAANVEYGDDLVEIEAAPLAATADPSLEAVAAGLCAHLVLRWLVARDTTLPGVMFALEPRPAPALSEHFVLRVPRCPACSNATRVAPRLPWHEARAA